MKIKHINVILKAYHRLTSNLSNSTHKPKTWNSGKYLYTDAWWHLFWHIEKWSSAISCHSTHKCLKYYAGWKSHLQRSSVVWFHLHKVSARSKVTDTQNSLETTEGFAWKETGNYYLMSTEFLLVIMKTSEIIKWWWLNSTLYNNISELYTKGGLNNIFCYTHFIIIIFKTTFTTTTCHTSLSCPVQMLFHSSLAIVPCLLP